MITDKTKFKNFNSKLTKYLTRSTYRHCFSLHDYLEQEENYKLRLGLPRLTGSWSPY